MPIFFEDINDRYPGSWLDESYPAGPAIRAANGDLIALAKDVVVSQKTMDMWADYLGVPRPVLPKKKRHL